ncbi:MAG: hypothetical protein WCH39_00370, partial [Schlesneria sp.]
GDVIAVALKITPVIAPWPPSNTPIDPALLLDALSAMVVNEVLEIASHESSNRLRARVISPPSYSIF